MHAQTVAGLGQTLSVLLTQLSAGFSPTWRPGSSIDVKVPTSLQSFSWSLPRSPGPDPLCSLHGWSLKSDRQLRIVAAHVCWWHAGVWILSAVCDNTTCSEHHQLHWRSHDLDAIKQASTKSRQDGVPVVLDYPTTTSDTNITTADRRLLHHSSPVCHDLGIYIDCNLSMQTHVQRTVSTVSWCFAALHQLCQIHRSVPSATLQGLVVALVHS